MYAANGLSLAASTLRGYTFMTTPRSLWNGIVQDGCRTLAAAGDRIAATGMVATRTWP
ncbi:MAG: hypothetical protein INR70_17065 [Parafilimonas terrae]|jgi:hypothetical protein|nr:hypothetical protein [Parafilimonas terrae]